MRLPLQNFIRLDEDTYTINPSVMRPQEKEIKTENVIMPAEVKALLIE
jgi:hypothetical protein